jgi:hypothetical protein
MSQVIVLNKFIPYLRQVLNDLGYHEHEDEFDQDNIASTVIDKTYMITPQGLRSSRSSHLTFEWTFPVVVTLFFSGYRKPSEAVDGSLEQIELFLDEVLDVSERYSVQGLADLYPTSIDFNPVDQSNDTIVQASIGLTAIINMFNDKNC